MKDLLDKLQAHQTTIHVCEACANKRLMPPDEMIDRAKISGGAVLVDLMAAPEYQVFIFLMWTELKCPKTPKPSR